MVNLYLDLVEALADLLVGGATGLVFSSAESGSADLAVRRRDVLGAAGTVAVFFCLPLPFCK